MSKLKCEHEYSPFGEQIDSYELKGERGLSYSIHRVNANFCDDQKFIEWYSRLETFLVFFIDAASTIDKDDPNWIIYLLYQQYRNHHGEICYTPMGFITVYLYYAYPDMKRPRISQVLILPPYQRKGHGRRLLTTIYHDLKKDSRVQDITGMWVERFQRKDFSFYLAEDPSDEFLALRDLVAFELCQKHLPNLFSKSAILKTDRLTSEMIEQARKICKLTRVIPLHPTFTFILSSFFQQETRRAYELSLLRASNEHDDEQMKRVRLTIKQRLFEPLQVRINPMILPGKEILF